jgi:RNA polymerase sigma factor (sigma-70 family)
MDNEFNDQSNTPSELRLNCQRITQTLIEKYEWSLLSAEELTALVLSIAQTNMSPVELEQLVKHYYTVAMYGACRQTENLAHRERGYQELFRFLFRVAYHRWPDLAEDVTQRALVLIYEQIERCQSPGTFLAFALNKLRHAHQQELRGRGREMPQEDMVGDEANSDQSEILLHLEEEEQLKVLLAAIQQLPDERQRTVVFLKFFKGLRDEIISAQLNSTASHVRVLRHRALARLRNDPILQNYIRQP